MPGHPVCLERNCKKNAKMDGYCHSCFKRKFPELTHKLIPLSRWTTRSRCSVCDQPSQITDASTGARFCKPCYRVHTSDEKEECFVCCSVDVLKTISCQSTGGCDRTLKICSTCVSFDISSLNIHLLCRWCHSKDLRGGCLMNCGAKTLPVIKAPKGRLCSKCFGNDF